MHLQANGKQPAEWERLKLQEKKEEAETQS